MWCVLAPQYTKEIINEYVYLLKIWSKIYFFSLSPLENLSVIPTKECIIYTHLVLNLTWLYALFVKKLVIFIQNLDFCEIIGTNVKLIIFRWIWWLVSLLLFNFTRETILELNKSFGAYLTSFFGKHWSGKFVSLST